MDSCHPWGSWGKDEWQQRVGGRVPRGACREGCHCCCWLFPASMELRALPTATEEVVLSFLLECGLASF